MAERKLPIVIDTGSTFTKCGYGGESSPLLKIPSVRAFTKHGSWMIDMDYLTEIAEKRKLSKRVSKSREPVGFDALEDAIFPHIYLKHIVREGGYLNTNDGEKMWHHLLYHNLEIKPSEHPVILTDYPVCFYDAQKKKRNLERMIEAMMESFEVPYFYLADSSVLSIFASQRTTGLLVESRGVGTRVVPVYEGMPIHHAIETYEFSGRDVTDRLQKLVNEKDPEFFPCRICRSLSVFDLMKVSMGFVSQDTANEKVEDETYSIGCEMDCKVKIQSEMYEAPEIMFGGLQQKIRSSVMKCEEELREVMLSNIVLSGGNTMFDGFAERLRTELLEILPSIKWKNELNVEADPKREDFAWIGGSLCSSFIENEKAWISQEEYDEVGPSLVHRKCIMGFQFKPMGRGIDPRFKKKDEEERIDFLLFDEEFRESGDGFCARTKISTKNCSFHVSSIFL